MIDRFAAAYLFQEFLQFMQAVDWNQTIDRIADHLVGRISEQTLRSSIPAGDRAVQRLADDSVVRMLDDRRQTAGGVFRSLPFGNVTEDQYDTADRSVLFRDWCATVIDRVFDTEALNQDGMVS
jgi:hypothetical protein